MKKWIWHLRLPTSKTTFLETMNFLPLPHPMISNGSCKVIIPRMMGRVIPVVNLPRLLWTAFSPDNHLLEILSILGSLDSTLYLKCLLWLHSLALLFSSGALNINSTPALYDFFPLSYFLQQTAVQFQPRFLCRRSTTLNSWPWFSLKFQTE